MKIKNIELKIIIGILAFFLAFLIGYIFVKVFFFEGDKKEGLSLVTDSKIESLYNIISLDSYYNRNTFYNSYFTKFNNLDYDYIGYVTYNYLEKNNRLEKNNFSKEELIDANLNKEYKPLTKIDINTFNQATHEIFGSDIKIYNVSFNITENIKAKYDEEKKMIYVYETSETKEEYYVYRKIDSYEIKSDNSLAIYDYFVKCNKNTGDCYYDDKMTSKNNKIKYENGKLSSISKENMAKYVHNFKNEDDKFYWYSSNLIAK